MDNGSEVQVLIPCAFGVPTSLAFLTHITFGISYIRPAWRREKVPFHLQVPSIENVGLTGLLWSKYFVYHPIVQQYMSRIVHIYPYVYVNKWIVKSTTKMHHAVTWSVKSWFFIAHMKVAMILALLHISLHLNLQLDLLNCWQVMWLCDAYLWSF